MFDRKIRMSMRAAHSGAQFVGTAGYCEMWYLLNRRLPFAYNAGMYGWNNDTYYIVDSAGNSWAISTGYRNTQGERLPYDLIHEYEEKAKQTADSSERDKILKDFLAKVATEHPETYRYGRF